MSHIPARDEKHRFIPDPDRKYKRLYIPCIQVVTPHWDRRGYREEGTMLCGRAEAHMVHQQPILSDEEKDELAIARATTLGYRLGNPSNRGPEYEYELYTRLNPALAAVKVAAMSTEGWEVKQMDMEAIHPPTYWILFARKRENEG